MTRISRELNGFGHSEELEFVAKRGVTKIQSLEQHKMLEPELAKQPDQELLMEPR
ncbi:GD12968 [Drosophila simulans]|uniref:GD12968 n=1 Tax=Drosophila simulans TaxID=7240 RepID=B4QM64_DROSI|nr:GD12968 [Drosophila simulans]